MSVPIPAPVERPKETPFESLKVSPERAFEVPPVAETLSAHDPQTLPPVFEKLKLFEFVKGSVWKAEDPPWALNAWLLCVALTRSVDPPAEVDIPTDAMPYPATVKDRASTDMPDVLPAVFEVAAKDRV